MAFHHSESLGSSIFASGVGFGVQRSDWFLGGLWGAALRLVFPRPAGVVSMWVLGLGLGIAAALVGLFIVPLIKGLPVAGGWVGTAFVRPVLISGLWGIGV